MLTSAMKLPIFTLSALTGVLLFTLSGVPAPAQERGPLASQATPGQVTEVIAPSAIVVSTAHYQVQLTLGCSNSACTGDFPNPGSKRRLNVTRITCEISGSSGAAFLEGLIRLIKADGSHVLFQFLPVDYSLPSYSVHLLNRAVDMQVGARQRIRVILQLTSGTAAGAICTATGTLDKLQ